MNKNPYTDLQFNGSAYDIERDKILKATQNIYDANIGETSNQAALSGAVAGVANPSRITAETYAKVAGERDARQASITAEMGQQKANAATSFDTQKQLASAEWAASQPNFFDYATGGFSALASVVQPLASIGLFDNLFSKWKKTKATSQPSYKPTQGGGYNWYSPAPAPDTSGTGQGIPGALNYGGWGGGNWS